MFLIVALFFIATIVSLILYARWNYGTLEKLGLPVDKPHFLLGNTKDIFKIPGGEADIERFKRLGPIHGVYEGRSPQIHICDAELIRLVTTKDAEFFNSKRILDFKDPVINEMPDFQPYEKWKAIRSLLTPAFTAAKIKSMNQPITQTLESFTKELKNEVSSNPGGKLEKYDLRDAIFVMLTDMISKSCFSVQIDNPNDPNNRFAKIVRDLMAPSNIPLPTVEVLSYSYPFLGKLLPGIFSPKACEDFCKIFNQMMDSRRKSGQKNKDILELCMDMMDKVNTPEFKRVNITEKTVACQALLFFFAGQDQLSTITAAMIYYVLQNPKIEKQLYDEVDEFVKKHGTEYKHENLSELQYLLACINETLRLVPFFTRTERVCTKDWKNEEFNLEIKKGMTVIIPIWSTNRNPKHFPNPEKFDPERFLPENKEKLHPYAFTSFGFGPRNCIGMKFSYEVFLLMSVAILKDFKFHLRSDSKPEFIGAGPFFSPHLPFYFDITLRNKK